MTKNTLIKVLGLAATVTTTSRKTTIRRKPCRGLKSIGRQRINSRR